MLFSLEMFRAYIALFPHERDAFPVLEQQLHCKEKIQNRKNYRGHLTASALVFNRSMDQVLLVHHKGLNKWLQPGGHLEEDSALWHAAQREVLEETGIKGLQLHKWHSDHLNIPLDVDSHEIPARAEKNEPGHLHHDCLFVAIALDETKTTPQSEEIYCAKWVPLDLLATDVRLYKVYRKLRDIAIVS